MEYVLPKITTVGDPGSVGLAVGRVTQKLNEGNNPQGSRPAAPRPQSFFEAPDEDTEEAIQGYRVQSPAPAPVAAPVVENANPKSNTERVMTLAELARSRSNAGTNRPVASPRPAPVTERARPPATNPVNESYGMGASLAGAALSKMLGKK